ncbi:hypothetical protein ECC02_004314 [Trypanosoma cruzi]|uniref:Uncharacterized protein n=1 Tax=Trypanosoma cruzi TaxID=5693 RepID=A0A7J6Y8A4_TRYCR|nr:hypothetical protein ECC02_004314 [Trypanosoma cruzi]
MFCLCAALGGQLVNRCMRRRQLLPQGEPIRQIHVMCGLCVPQFLLKLPHTFLELSGAPSQGLTLLSKLLQCFQRRRQLRCKRGFGGPSRNSGLTKSLRAANSLSKLAGLFLGLAEAVLCLTQLRAKRLHHTLRGIRTALQTGNGCRQLRHMFCLCAALGGQLVNRCMRRRQLLPQGEPIRRIHVMCGLCVPQFLLKLPHTFLELSGAPSQGLTLLSKLLQCLQRRRQPYCKRGFGGPSRNSGLTKSLRAANSLSKLAGFFLGLAEAVLCLTQLRAKRLHHPLRGIRTALQTGNGCRQLRHVLPLCCARRTTGQSLHATAIVAPAR